MNNIMGAVMTGVVDSIVFAILIYLIQIYRYRQNLTNKFNNRTFYSFYKELPDDSVQTIKLSVKQNVIKFKGTRKSDDDTFEGELIMNPINLKIGEGFYYHTKSEGYGFYKVIIKDDNTFLIEAPYIKIKVEDKTGATIQQAFIWRRNK